MGTDAAISSANYLSGAAIAISLFSLGLAAYLAFRDRSHVSAAASYLSSFEHMADAVYLHVVNDGRRAITIRRLVIVSDTGARFEHKFQREGRALRLVESEDVEIALDSNNSEIAKWLTSKMSKAHIEDSTGKLFVVDDLVEILNEHSKTLRNTI